MSLVTVEIRFVNCSPMLWIPRNAKNSSTMSVLNIADT
jgi:hypothetical protein